MRSACWRRTASGTPHAPLPIPTRWASTRRSTPGWIARSLPNHHLVEIPGYGHDFVAGCDVPLITAFLAGPAAELDTSCLGDLPTIASLMLFPGGSKLIPASFGLPLVFLLGSVAAWPVSAGVGRLRSRCVRVREPASEPHECPAAGT